MRRLSLLGVTTILSLLGSFSLCGAVGCSSVQHELATDQPPPPIPPPLKDSDGDGIFDGEDACPNTKEDGLPPKMKDGCPTNDPDLDGVPFPLDQCPEEKETMNGYRDNDGCPDLAELSGSEIKIHEQILFEKGSAKIDPTSNKLIASVADVIKENVGLNFIEVAGHADIDGGDALNRRLTQQRADAVVKKLIESGVSALQLRAVGYSSYCPVDIGTDEVAKEKNRRVEFKVLLRNGELTENKWGGCEDAMKKKMAPEPVPASAPRIVDPKAKAKPKDDVKTPAPTPKNPVQFLPGSKKTQQPGTFDPKK
jgi:OmpA-OmpF porin, OOP family